MCIVCRKRLEQSTMNRFQCKENEIISFSGVGRSFYICTSCINNGKLDKIIQRICKIDREKTKEIIVKIKGETVI